MSDGSRVGRVVTAAPNFAYEWTAQRGLPTPGEDIDLSNVVMIIGSEPVSIDAIRTFNKAFAPYGLPRTAFKPSYGIAEATLFVATIDPDAEAAVAYFDREQLGAGHAVRVAADAPNAVAQVSVGRVARSLWAVIVNPETHAELPDGEVGEIWLQGNNVGRGYWRMPNETRIAFGARLQSRLGEGSHADGSVVDGTWLRTGDLGVYVEGELYVTGRIVDLVTIDGSQPLPRGHRGHRRGRIADGAAGIRDGVLGTRGHGRGPAPGDHCRTCRGHQPCRSPAGNRGHRGRGTAPSGSDRLRCAFPPGRRDPAHHQWQAGPPGLPRPIPQRYVGHALARDRRSASCSLIAPFSAF